MGRHKYVRHILLHQMLQLPKGKQGPFDPSRAYTSILIDCAGESTDAMVMGCNIVLCRHKTGVVVWFMYVARSCSMFYKVYFLGKTTAAKEKARSIRFRSEFDPLSWPEHLNDLASHRAECLPTGQNCHTFAKAFATQDLDVTWPQDLDIPSESSLPPYWLRVDVFERDNPRLGKGAD
jgi:hypothetical protein